MLKVAAIHAFSDNYIWCIIDEQNYKAVVIDPGCSKSVLNFLNVHNLDLIGILITHHHPDHIGGVAELKLKTNAQTYGFKHAGPIGSKLTFIDHSYIDGDTFFVLDTEFKVLEVPGHTLDHIAFYSEIGLTHTSPWLFCGDTLFSGGCGRLFEGSASQMHHSLSKLASLPIECKVYCAHEYTLNNLEFAATLMPNNEALQSYKAECKVKRTNNAITLPSTIERELAINPFLRMHDPELIVELGITYNVTSIDPELVFAATRKAKDRF
jgi:hydroxyacylglutathione hydrolase